MCDLRQWTVTPGAWGLNRTMLQSDVWTAYGSRRVQYGMAVLMIVYVQF